MPRQYSDTRSGSFSLEPTFSHVQVGSGDPAIIEQANILLSQFMGHSSHETQTSQAESNSNIDGVLQSRANLHNISKPVCKDDTERWQTTRVTPEDSTHESSSTRHGPLVQRSATQILKRSHTRRLRHNPSTDSGPSIENMGVDHDCSVSMSKNGKKHSIPMIKQGQQTSYFLTSSETKSPTQTVLKSSGTRRSVRSRTGPVNYYETPYPYSYDTEQTEKQPELSRSNTGSPLPQQSDCPSPSCDQDIQLPVLMRHSLIYSSPELQILKSPVTGLSGMEHAPYCMERNLADFARKSSDELNNPLHVDFEQQEMRAILEILSLFYFQVPSCPEVALADQVIQAVLARNPPRKFSKGVSWMCQLNELILQEKIRDSNSWILELLSSSPDKKKLRHAKRLVLKILELQKEGRNATLLGSHGELDYQIEAHRLSSCLQYASALGRRHCLDVDRFITDAKTGCLPSIPSIIQATKYGCGHLPIRKAAKSSATFNRLLQSRELGCNVNQRLSSNAMDKIKPVKKWKGASNDVIVLAWSPDGTKFAAGATAQCDEHNMEYNRGNNLLLGDLAQNRLEELADHHISRPSGRAHSGRAVNDHRLFMSVTAVQWFHEALYTASYDNTVKIWNFSNGKASCYKTLQHDAKVQVMARSNFERNILATGTHSIGLWNVERSRYTPLEMPRQRSRKDIELVPTSLAWGTTPFTKHILLAGMSEKDDGIPQNGLLAAWSIGEAALYPMPLSPNSQNIFDLKWHPTSGAFATASPSGQRGPKSVVRHYEPLKSRTRTYEFDCDALDINDVTFCPVNPNYVTASCTNGITYVWDSRKHNEAIHKLCHGDPLNQTDETLPREQADVGVRVALWGDTINSFFTGASDGILKRWNILKSPEDALVEDMASFNEEIMCAAFSNDKSNLLVGDAAGGIHVLSSGPFSDTQDSSFDFKRAPQPPYDDYESESESGVVAARRLLSSGRLERHPVYGAGQGPHYDGPYAAWARSENIPPSQIAEAPLREAVQMRQLHGTPLPYRTDLDKQSRRDVELQIQLAQIRNVRQHKQKRKRPKSAASKQTALVSGGVFIDLCSDDEGSSHRPNENKRRAAKAHHPIINTKLELIDLTEDTDTEGSEDSAEELEEKLEEDFWWPESRDVDPNIQDADV